MIAHSVDVLFINETGHRVPSVAFSLQLSVLSSSPQSLGMLIVPHRPFTGSRVFSGDIASVDIALYLFRFFCVKSTERLPSFRRGLAFMQTNKNCWKILRDRHNRISERSNNRCGAQKNSFFGEAKCRARWQFKTIKGKRIFNEWLLISFVRKCNKMI